MEERRVSKNVKGTVMQILRALLNDRLRKYLENIAF